MPLIDLQLTQQPTDLNLAFVKQYLRVDYATDDSIINMLIQAAREECEHYCNRTFVTSKYKAYYDLITLTFKIPKAPIQSIDKVTLIYLGQQTVLNPSADYYIQANQDQYIILTVTTYNLPPGFSYKNYDFYRFNLQVDFTSGYDSDYPATKSGSLIPASIQLAILKTIASNYELRANVEAISRQGISGFIELPNDAKKLLNAYRIIPV